MVLILYCAVTVGLAWLLAGYMHRVFSGRRVWPSPLIRPLERACLAAAGPAAARPQGWAAYATAVLTFNLAGFLFLYAVLRLQGVLPWNPQGIEPMPPDLAFNTAASFVTNTNWQAYSGEVQLSHLAQMVGLTVQNFVSAATGMAVAVAVIRGFVARGDGRLGNFWTDMVRAVLYVLLPISVLVALALVWQGVPQTLGGAVRAITLEGAEQIIAQGPAASQVAIKQLGTNGGGFFGVNSAHPLENPTILSNMVQSVLILLIPVAFCFLFGRMVGDRRQGWAIFAAMGVLFVVGLLLIHGFEQAGNPMR
ncbi:potassium-transporting ATPase subunit KdpA [Paracoccus marcusii]|uniref:potassium-transporting ATPase subunit KdpA n=1 Tax=Paracoccus marcusii TaxID=59779 RepID=UPI0031ECCBA4